MESEKISPSNLSKRASTEHTVAGRQTALQRRFARAQTAPSGSRAKLLCMILENPEDTFFLLSGNPAKRYKIDAATIVRTIPALGYARFAAFAADLRAF